jgi:hypothetical protein
MTVQELIKELEAFQGDMKVGGADDFGDMMEVYDVGLYKEYGGIEFIRLFML